MPEGSGWLVASGLILTARHVVQGSDSIQVRLYNAYSSAKTEEHRYARVEARRIWAGPDADDQNDIALLAIEGAEATPVDWGYPDPMKPDGSNKGYGVGVPHFQISKELGERDFLPFAGTVEFNQKELGHGLISTQPNADGCELNEG